MPKVNKYEHIPPVGLADNCSLFERCTADGIEALIRYNVRRYSIDADGKTIVDDKHDKPDAGYYYSVKNQKKYALLTANGEVYDWDLGECTSDYLGPINQNEFKRVLEAKNFWLKDKKELYTGKEIKNINFYFYTVIKGFESWFDQWGVEVPKINEEIGVDDLTVKEEENKPIFQFDFEKIRAYATNLESSEAILYYFFILKEFDKEKRENSFLFMTDREIEYWKIEIMRPHIMEEPPDFKLMGIGAKQSIAKENFEININNEIEFIKKKIELAKTLEKNETINIEKLKREKIREESERRLEQKNPDLLLLEKVNKEKRLLENKETIQPLNNELNNIEDSNYIKMMGNVFMRYKLFEKLPEETRKILVDETYILNKIRDKNTVSDKLHYLDSVENDLVNFEKEINYNTSPKILDIGDITCTQVGKTEWKFEYFFLPPKSPFDLGLEHDYNEEDYTDLQIESEAQVWNQKHYLEESKREDYFQKYKKEIALLSRIRNIQDLINKEREFNKEQFFKYPPTNISTTKIDDDTSQSSDVKYKLEEFKKACETRKLQKDCTVRTEVLYEIMKEAGFKVPENILEFKSNHRLYKIGREYLSRLKYKKPRR